MKIFIAIVFGLLSFYTLCLIDNCIINFILSKLFKTFVWKYFIETVLWGVNLIINVVICFWLGIIFGGLYGIIVKK